MATLCRETFDSAFNAHHPTDVEIHPTKLTPRAEGGDGAVDPVPVHGEDAIPHLVLHPDLRGGNGVLSQAQREPMHAGEVEAEERGKPGRLEVIATQLEGDIVQTLGVRSLDELAEEVHEQVAHVVAETPVGADVATQVPRTHRQRPEAGPSCATPQEEVREIVDHLSRQWCAYEIQNKLLDSVASTVGGHHTPHTAGPGRRPSPLWGPMYGVHGDRTLSHVHYQSLCARGGWFGRHGRELPLEEVQRPHLVLQPVVEPFACDEGPAYMGHPLFSARSR